ncbi:elongation factor 2 [Striga asiatica]|uniref:Elongation factor 2 n=1 Tax=Striga asiatica TaxID=4170 RepID=A0A5A7Q232_STRAF|nr:elongation factor 2 [Striga asiatica]
MQLKMWFGERTSAIFHSQIDNGFGCACNSHYHAAAGLGFTADLLGVNPLLQCSWKSAVRGGKRLVFSSGTSFTPGSMVNSRGLGPVRAFFPNPIQEPILKEALKEPVAFVGGIFAGLLRLNLNEEPLKEWVSRTVEASGLTLEEISKSPDADEEDVPQQIEIE